MHLGKMLKFKWPIMIMSFQVIVVLSVYIKSIYPLWYGKPVRLEIMPVDPRSLFRGQYVNLNLNISRLSRNKIEGIPYQIHEGRKIFVNLENHDGVFRSSGASIHRPMSETFITAVSVK